MQQLAGLITQLYLAWGYGIYRCRFRSKRWYCGNKPLSPPSPAPRKTFTKRIWVFTHSGMYENSRDLSHHNFGPELFLFKVRFNRTPRPLWFDKFIALLVHRRPLQVNKHIAPHRRPLWVDHSHKATLSRQAHRNKTKVNLSRQVHSATLKATLSRLFAYNTALKAKSRFEPTKTRPKPNCKHTTNETQCMDN